MHCRTTPSEYHDHESLHSIAASVVAPSKTSCAPKGIKRSVSNADLDAAADSDAEDHVTSYSARGTETQFSEQKKGTRAIVCVACFQANRRCDDGPSCQSCLDHHVKCVRAKCKDWGIGACKRQSCTRVHEDDPNDFKKAIWCGHVTKKLKGGSKDGFKKSGSKKNGKTRRGNGGTRRGGGGGTALLA